MSEKSTSIKIIRVDANHCGGYRFGQEYYACLAGYQSDKGETFSENDYCQVAQRDVFEKPLPEVLRQLMTYGIKKSMTVKKSDLNTYPSYDEFTVVY